MNNHTRLWRAVLAQAYTDLEAEPLDSREHIHAVAWFFSPSREQREARQFVADAVGLTPDDLRPPACAIVNRRRAEAGMPLLCLEIPPAAPIPLPRLEAVFRPPEPEPRHTGGRRHYDRFVFAARRAHVFDPWAKLPSEPD